MKHDAVLGKYYFTNNPLGRLRDLLRDNMCAFWAFDVIQCRRGRNLSLFQYWDDHILDFQWSANWFGRIYWSLLQDWRRIFLLYRDIRWLYILFIWTVALRPNGKRRRNLTLFIHAVRYGCDNILSDLYQGFYAHAANNTSELFKKIVFRTEKMGVWSALITRVLLLQSVD